MPLTLVVRKTSNDAGEEARALTFDGSRVVIGRGDGCDVRLPDPSVSHRHASVRVDGATHSLIDEGSTNGTFVGDIQLSAHTPRVLRSGDLVRVGRVWLEVRIDQTPATRELSMATRDLALLLVSQAMHAQGDDIVPKVHVVEGPDRGSGIALGQEGRAYSIGRDETCDLCLGDRDASREHAQLVRRGGIVLVRDLGSKNGVLLGESRVPEGRDVVWRNTATLRIGATVLALEEPVAIALASLEEADDEPMTPDGPTNMPPVAPNPEPEESLPLENIPPPVGSQRNAMPRAMTPSAPIAEMIARASEPAPLPKRRSGGWSPTDLAVVLLALVVIASSIAGLFWLLKS